MSSGVGEDCNIAAVNEEISQLNCTIERLQRKREALILKKEKFKQFLLQKASEELANQDWEKTDHPWSAKVNEVLKTSFKLNSFRPYQLATINAVMSNENCILLMPTGGGKSLCYQLPAMVLSGITLVVSPLISLMEDQIMALDALKIPATLLNASSGAKHTNYVHKEMTEKVSELKLIYVTPEKLSKSKRFITKLQKMYQMGKFSLLAIDEVHCCSQWGHDFRPDYKFLGIMKRQFPNVPIIGLTATATSSVICDVQKILSIQGCLVLKASFNRPNLKYEVCCKSSNQKENVDELEKLLKHRFNGLTGIIYCFSIKDSEDIASELRKRNIIAMAYHAQLEAEVRKGIHHRWSSGSIQVIVATIAFGMGIDKPNVRFVIHHSMPKSMENFYQESGRAGRDNQKACCILFYRFADIFRQSTMIFTDQKGLEHLYGMVAYCLDLCRCRRSIIAQHFGERWESIDCEKMCDHCENQYQEIQKNVTKEYQTICRILNHCNAIEERLTAQKLIDIWLGKGVPKTRPPNHVGVSYSRETCERIVAFLLLETYLIEEFHFTPYSTISYINLGSRKAALPNSSHEIMMTFPSHKRKRPDEIPSSSSVAVKKVRNSSISSNHSLKKDERKSVPQKASDNKSLVEKQQSDTKTEISSISSNHSLKKDERKLVSKKASDNKYLVEKQSATKTESCRDNCDMKRKLIEIDISDDSMDFAGYDLEVKTKSLNKKKKTVSILTVSDSD